jgi:hypothetical protein
MIEGMMAITTKEYNELIAEIERLRDDSRMLALCEEDRKEMAAEIDRLRSTTEISPVHVQELQADNKRLRAVLQEIADLRYSNTSAATIARRALEPKP